MLKNIKSVTTIWWLHFFFVCLYPDSNKTDMEKELFGLIKNLVDKAKRKQKTLIELGMNVSYSDLHGVETYTVFTKDGIGFQVQYLWDVEELCDICSFMSYWNEFHIQNLTVNSAIKLIQSYHNKL